VDLIIPVLRDFRPELILVSAGFDGHAEDPLSYIDLRNSSYYKMMHVILYISRIQANGEDNGGFYTGIVLEGGYSYRALAGSILKVIDACLEKNVQRKIKDENTLAEFLGTDIQGPGAANPENIENFKRIKKSFGI
jgi:acetoin utilization deacetylase AcuC-like enzyme